MTKLTLTFDNGPTPGVTEHVLDVLRRRDIKATFFVLGQNLSSQAGRDIAAAAHSEGHWIGNHTMHHGPPLGEWEDAGAAVLEISAAQDRLGDLAHPGRLFRPTGRGTIGVHLFSEPTLEYLMSHRYTVVLWTVFVRDSKQPEGWAERALAKLGQREWDVLVVHDLPTGAMGELARFVDAAADRGVELTQDFPADVVPLEAGVLTGAASHCLPRVATSSNPRAEV